MSVITASVLAVGAILVGLSMRRRSTEPLAVHAIFRLQDPIDGLCLGPPGFVPCDASTLWIIGLTRGRRSLVSWLHASEEAKCLERVETSKYDSKVRLASCKAKRTFDWEIVPRSDGAMITSERKHCLARNPFGNFVTMQSCEFGYTPLKIVEMPIQQGFLLTTESSAICFDGVRFRACDTDDPTLYWAVAIRFDRPRGEGYFSFFKVHPERFDAGQKCLSQESTRRGAPTKLADCSHAGAKRWTLDGPHLVHYDRGKQYCVKRDVQTGAPGMQLCTEGATHLYIALPASKGPTPSEATTGAATAPESRPPPRPRVGIRPTSSI